jgi:hypothetical protein
MVDLLRVELAQAVGEKIRLLLIVAFDIDAVTRADDRGQDADRVLGFKHLRTGLHVLGNMTQALLGIQLHLVPYLLLTNRELPISLVHMPSSKRLDGASHFNYFTR